MVKKSVDNLLLLLHKLLAFFEAVTLALDVDDGTMMEHPVEDGGGDGNVGEDLVPLGKGLVGGKASGGFFITPGNELKEEVGPLNIHRKAADLVDDEEFVLAEDFKFVGQMVLKMGLF